ncbi:MAG: FCD domain-containing protein [Actinomycetota bacterium]
MARTEQALSLRAKGDRRKLAEIVAEQIEGKIVARGWPIGEVLGSEGELLAQYGVSRAVLREAVRIVEHHMAAAMRRGPSGGLVVTAPDIGAVVRTVALQLQFQNIGPHHLFEARTALELSCVRQATTRIARDGIVRLQNYLEREEQLVAENLTEHTHDFHILIADLTGNPALRLFVQILGRLTGQQALPPPSDEWAAREVHRTHAAIAEAIIKKDPDTAERRMLRHLQAITGWLRAPEEKRPQGSRSAGTPARVS